MTQDLSRLSDRILSALELAIDQEDIDISELLVQAIELSMTRKTGGGHFVERRNYSEELKNAIQALEDLKNKK